MHCFRFAISIFLSLYLVSCVQVPDSPAFKAATERPDRDYVSFSDYQEKTRAWLERQRIPITDKPEQEIDANMPKEWMPLVSGAIRRGVLLVHGLGDSPYSFVDLAPELSKRGFLVRTVLLEGHGTKPGDLEWPSSENWLQTVRRHKELLRQHVDEVWLGGFSTGANLVTIAALEDPEVAGLFLFSPAYIPNRRSVALAPFVANFATWVDVDPNDNYVRYDSLTFQAAGEYYKTSRDARALLDELAFNRPALLVASERDSVVNTEAVVNLFETRFTHPASRFVWFGRHLENVGARVIRMEPRVPEQRISNISHMAALFSPNNPYYGAAGSFRLCNNGQAELEKLCPGVSLWYSAYGYREPGKVHARLTWNPHFEQMLELIKDVVSSTPSTPKSQS